MIKIIAGYVSVSGEIKTDKSEPFSTTPEYEKELVDKGFATYVNEEIKKVEEPKQQETPENNTLNEPKKEEVIPTTKMTFDQLKAIALSKGIDEKLLVDDKGKNITKAKVVELILKVADEEESTEEEGEELDLGNGVEGIV